MEASVGAGGLTMLNAPFSVALPAGLFTVTLRPPPPRPAVGATVKVAVMVVSFTTVKLLTVTPLPLTAALVAPVKPIPVMVTATLVPRAPEVGLMAVTAGPTLKLTVLLVPFGEVTLTVRVVVLAVAGMAQFAVTVVPSAVDVTLEQVMTLPVPVPDMLTDVAPARPLPLSVTGTVVPRLPEVGLIDVRVGPATVNELLRVAAPPLVVTVTLREFSAAPEVMRKVVVSELPLA